MLLGAMIAQALDADVHGTFGQQSAVNGADITYICEKTMEENHTIFEVTA